MPFITQYNCGKILRSVDYQKIDPKHFNQLYKQNIWILSYKEQAWLASAKLLFDDPSAFLKEAYVKNSPIDTKKFVYEGNNPAYHEDKNCDRIKSNYNNFEIPQEIIHKGDREIERFRKWFKSNHKLYEDNQNRFLSRLQATFFLQNPPNKVTGSNSGIVEFNDVNISTLEDEIDQLMEQAKLFYFKSDVHQNTIDINGNRSFFVAKSAKKDSIIYIWHNSYKEKLKEKLMHYFRVKLNPDLEFSGKLLQTLNFRECNQCCCSIDFSKLAL
ncbi:hypothetical protein [Endozoicomonas numazuensis]|uniref:Uncharacterized protein n=1 Tax=Endozoicomonas numazuensis TaxID=1137799 RepID=A0A081MYE5_9GAMM|nr:hypothetical protein [Endozoicomonas numazuensis]KEQ11218.1 hypothetical protein GZ78_29275 [Endozoicomonas numazuensis]